jgi:hypothetical protein
MIRKRLQKRVLPDGRGYAPKLTVTVEGQHDVYRLARLLEMAGLRHGGTVHLHRLGVRILTSMDRQAPGIVAELTRELGPARVTHRGRRRKPQQLHLGMSAAELALAEEAVH